MISTLIATEDGTKLAATSPAFIAAAGPRGLSPDVPVETRRSMFRSPSFAGFREKAAALARRTLNRIRREQTAIAKQNDQTEFQATDGLGVPFMRISSELYMAMIVKYGADCWDDPDFVEAFARDFPECRVKTTRGTRGQEYGGRAGVFRGQRSEDSGQLRNPIPTPSSKLLAPRVAETTVP